MQDKGKVRPRKNRGWMALCALSMALAASAQAAPGAAGSNPIIRDKFTADPAPLVVGDTLYLYVGHDEAQRDEMFNMREWLVYSTKDMRTWTGHAPITVSYTHLTLPTKA